MRRASVICTHLSRIRPARALTSHGGGSLASVAFGLALLAALAGCGPEGRDAESLERAVRRSLQLMNAEDWQAAYGEVLTASQRATCTAAEYARREGAGLAAIRDSLGPGELSVIELDVGVDGSVGMVRGTAIYTARLAGQVASEVGDASLRARWNLGTATVENPDYWIFEDGGWRWVQRNPDSPCYNAEDLKVIPSSPPSEGDESPG